MLKQYAVFLIFFCICLQSRSNGLQAAPDTVFIRRQVVTGRPYQAIFIDRNPNSAYYRSVTHFSVARDISYRENLTLLKGSRRLLPQHPVTGIAKEWCPLYLYHNKYYAYSPSDYSMNSLVKITDSLFFRYTEDGAVPSAVDSVIYLKNGGVRMAITSQANNHSSVTIYKIDASKGIAVFKYSDRPEGRNYQLLVDAKKIRQFPMIVNYSYQQEKVSEMDFDTPDFRKLLQGKDK